MATGIASGRLDLLGGVADYCGSLVLECATGVCTTVRASFIFDDRFTATTSYGGSPVTFAMPLAVLRRGVVALGEIRESLREHDAPSWMNYVFGSFAVLVRETGWLPPAGTGIAVDLSSAVPAAQGVSSSASVEVAVLRALVALSGVTVSPRRLAVLAQEAENYVCGAPCGISAYCSSRVEPYPLPPVRSLGLTSCPYFLSA
jgi:galactokinase